MKKTIKINISGLVFTLDEDAFDLLNGYLNSLNKKYSHDPEGNEIITDIEARIAELFRENIDELKEVVTINDVQVVVAQMGNPDEFELEEPSIFPESNTSNVFGSKRMYRDPEDRLLGGVSSGIAHYMGIDPLIIRILFIVLLLGFGSGIIIYLILWAVLPLADTSSQKLEMKGEPVTVSGIESVLRDEFTNVKSGFERITNSDIGERSRDVFSRILGFLFAILKGIGRFVLAIIGIFVVITGISLLFGLTMSILAGFGVFSVFSFMEYEPLPYVLNFIFNTSEISLAFLGLILLLGLPLIGVVYFGFKFIFRFKAKDKIIGIISLTSFLVGILIFAFLAFYSGKSFSKKANINEEIILSAVQVDTLYIQSFEPDVFRNHWHDFDIRFRDFSVITDSGEPMLYGRVKMKVKQSTDNELIMTIESQARGFDYENAQANAEDIIYNWAYENNTLTSEPYFTINKDNKWRDHRLYLILHIPVGTVVYFGDQAGQVMRSIRDENGYREYDYESKFWIMEQEGLRLQKRKILDDTVDKDESYGNTGNQTDSVSISNVAADGVSDADLEDMKNELSF